MEKVTLGDVCNMKSGGTPSRSNVLYWQKGTIPWVKISDLDESVNDYIYETEEYITKEGLASINHRLFKKGTLLLAMYGSVGKVGILGTEMSTNQAILGINPKKEKLDTKFLLYWFKSKQERLLNRAVGVALSNISKTIVSNLKIPLPSLPVQKAIASQLDKAQKLIQYNRQLLEKYDELQQSLFLDMFGDPVVNEKGWEKKKLGLVTKKIGSGATPKGGKQSYQSHGFSLIRSMNVYDSEFVYDDLAFINEKQAERLANVTVIKNDVLFNITGASICRSTIVPDEVLPARVNQHVAIIRPNSGLLNFIFLNRFFISDAIKRSLLKIGSGGGAIMQAITKLELENFEIIIPPLALQNEFSARIEAVEAQKELVKEALAKSEDIFRGLLQHYFSG